MIEIAFRRVTLGGVAARAILRPTTQPQAIGVGARYGAEPHAQGQTIAATSVQFQRMQGQVDIGCGARQPAEQQNSGARRIGRVGVTVQQRRDGSQ